MPCRTDLDGVPYSQPYQYDVWYSGLYASFTKRNCVQESHSLRMKALCVSVKVNQLAYLVLWDFGNCDPSFCETFADAI